MSPCPNLYHCHPSHCLYLHNHPHFNIIYLLACIITFSMFIIAFTITMYAHQGIPFHHIQCSPEWRTTPFLSPWLTHITALCSYPHLGLASSNSWSSWPFMPSMLLITFFIHIVDRSLLLFIKAYHNRY